MALYGQNTHYPKSQVPSYYTRNKVYGSGAYARTDWPTRTSRRIHDGLSIERNYGLDTTSDDVNSSPYSSPYYINGRYNSSNVTTQRGNSSSVQGTVRLASIGDREVDFTEDDIQTTISIWQGKQIRFKMKTESSRIVGNTISIRNIGGCRGLLSMYFSAKKDGPVLAETAIDLCSVSQDNFEHRKLYAMTTIPRTAFPRGEIYVRMEVQNDLDCERSTNPFNSGKVVEIAATGEGTHSAAVYELGEKNMPIDDRYDYEPHPNRPCLGFIYNDFTSVPVRRTEGVDIGATVSSGGYDYDIFCYKDETTAFMVAFDRNTNTVIPTKFPVSGSTEQVDLVQAGGKVYYVDGYSPLQRFEVGDWEHCYQFPVSTVGSVSVSINADTWVASGLAQDSGTFVFYYKDGRWEYKDRPVTLSTYGITVTGIPAEGGQITVTYIAATQTTEVDLKAQYIDTRPVLAPSIITFHNNRIYLSGFNGDPNLVQCSRIVAAGPDFDSYPYRFYVPNKSPLATSTNPITAIVETQSDELMITLNNGFTRYTSNVSLEDGTPSQVSSFSDGAGVAAPGDICSYRGVVYSFDPDEGLRYFAGAVWKKVAGQAIMTLYERVDMTKPRTLWGYAYKLHFNYTDKVDGKAKCIVYDMDMNWQQFPFFQDVDLPFCDVRPTNDFDLVGIHPDYPCIMRLYAQDVWRRLDTPIVFERWTKYLSLPGNAADMILRRVHIKVLANTNRWWNFGVSIDQHSQTQVRGKTITFRTPSWQTIEAEAEVEDPFITTTDYSETAVDLLTLPNLNARAVSVQIKCRAKTFSAPANLVSVLLESRVRQYN